MALKAADSGSEIGQLMLAGDFRSPYCYTVGYPLYMMPFILLTGAKTVFDIAPDADPPAQTARILDWMRARGPAEPVLILCDLYGATPFNIAAQALRRALEEGYVAHLLTGTNACMVLKALTDQQENPESLGERVRQGALRGIVNAEPPCDC